MDLKKKLKIDLHTHCYEATGYLAPTLDIVRRIVKTVKERNLDGIAITEHVDKLYGYQVKNIVEKQFDSEILIIPGQELNIWPVQVVELYLPEDVTFRFLAHPGYPGEYTEDFAGLHGIEIDNPLHNWHINKEKVRAQADKYGLYLLSNSDAHFLDDIGRSYNEVSLEDLMAMARGVKGPGKKGKNP